MPTPLTAPEQEALLTLALMPAFADGGKSAVEHAEFERVAESLPAGELNPASLYQRVLLRKATVPGAVACLMTPGARQLFYETAACIFEADDTLNESAQCFLTGLRREPGLDDQLRRSPPN